MACNRETSSDGTTSSATPVCQNPDGRVPCCNNKCHFFGCAATMNLCSKCYSEHILKEGGGFLNKTCDAPVDTPVVRSNVSTGARDAPVDTPVVRSNVESADEANDPHIGIDNSTERIVDVSSLGGSTVDTSSADASGFRQVLRSKDKSSLRSNMMHTSAGVSDLRAVFGLVETSSSVGGMFADTSDLRQQRNPSPLSLSAGSPRAFSPVRRQVETKLSLPPLPRQQAVNRCLTCRKRVGLLGFKCRCGDIFCAMHRYSDKHDCSFDYKAAGRAAIAKENPIVKASKIERI